MLVNLFVGADAAQGEVGTCPSMSQTPLPHPSDARAHVPAMTLVGDSFRGRRPCILPPNPSFATKWL